MVRERIADDIYMFSSKRYAHVNCGAVLTKEGAVLVDTLYFPDETRAVRDFLEDRLGHPVRYVINTHYHADHTVGTYLFPQAQVIGHALCREWLDTTGRAGLQRTQTQSPEFADATIVLPNMTVKKGELDIEVGGKKLRMIHMPGHSPDILAVHVLTDDILFASDNMMPVPTIFDGEIEALRSSLRRIATLAPDTIICGHGEVVLRGEVEHVVGDDLSYLAKMEAAVDDALANKAPRESLEEVSIEECGKSRIPLNGFAVELHLANLYRLYDAKTAVSAEKQPTPA